jgi:uroporphyrinogen-III synthase
MTGAQPLAGKRILITRARHQAGRLAEALEAQGAEVVRLPTIEIIPPESYAPLDAVLERIGGFDWLIVTSANGVAALDGRIQFLKIPLRRLQHLQVAAIGSATATALERIGLKVSAMPEEYVAEAVVALLKEKVCGQHVLLVRPEVARDVIPEQLRQWGADVEVVTAYRTVIPSDSIELARELLGEEKPLPDAVTFTSSSTVDNFFALLTATRLRLPNELRAVSIGPITSQTLRRHNWDPAMEASPYDIPGIVEACVRLLAQSTY